MNNHQQLEQLGFFYDWEPPTYPTNSIDHTPVRAIFRARKSLAHLVYNITALEDNPFTYPEVQTLLDGITVGGRKVSDAQQVINQANAWKMLFQQVQDETFALNKINWQKLHHKVAFEEALTWGEFRDGQVGIAGANYRPPSADKLASLFTQGIQAIHGVTDPLEKAGAIFLWGSLQQFFFDGNKRTSRLMASAYLLSQGLDVISIPATRQQEFNQVMMAFYETKDATHAMLFFASCSLDLDIQTQMNHKLHLLQHSHDMDIEAKLFSL